MPLVKIGQELSRLKVAEKSFCTQCEKPIRKKNSCMKQVQGRKYVFCHLTCARTWMEEEQNRLKKLVN